MIELTVRTLNSQNHAFTVEDDITVAQFKQHIAETVNIPADTQRIIYCGRVLNDDAKLNEFDVNGKVVHLVERAPPTEGQRGDGAAANRTQSPGPPPQVRRYANSGGAMYLGSMAIPIEPQNLVTPPASRSLAASRLNIARRMLRHAEAVIASLENPSARPAETAPAEEPQEEVTPVFEARVIVPAVTSEPLDEAFVLNAVQSSLMSANSNLAAGPSTQPSSLPESEAAAVAASSETAAFASSAPTASTSGSTPAPPHDETESPPARSASSTPEGYSPVSTSTEDLAGESRAGAASAENGGSLGERSRNASRTTEMADLLDTLNRLQARFAPFLARYQDFMRKDPAVERADLAKTDQLMRGVSQVLHYLGHAYHSLSDIIVRARHPPPRPLLCRPILIQHSAVLQAGFPIQVEAQINFASDPPTTSANTTAAPATSGESTTTSSTPRTTQSAPAPSAPPRPTATVNPSNVMNIPLMPPQNVHVQSFPIGIRSIRPANVRNAMTNLMGPTNISWAQLNGGVATGGISAGGPAGNSGGQQQGVGGNPNVEFFMEVTPESISIDSVETTLLGGIPASAPPPELIQSIMQMASHLGLRSAAAAVATTSANQPPTTQQPQSETSSQATANSTNAGQNSQARGNTQTNPTTATYTRSTARPHVHLAQHAMQGFDPFLPCNSHHINAHRNRVQSRNVANNNQPNATNNNQRGGGQEAGQQANAAQSQFNPLFNIVQGVLNSLQSVYNRRNSGTPQQSQPASSSSTSAAAPPPTTSAMPDAEARSPFDFGNIVDLANVLGASASPNARTPTIAQLLQQVGDHTEGEGIYNDLIMLLSRNFTIGDMLQLNNGHLEPLSRIRTELRNFIMDRILEGLPTPANIERGVNRLLAEMQPFLDNLSQLQVHDDIDIVRSTQQLFRLRLPNILTYAAAYGPHSIKMLVEQLKITSRHLFALILYASSNGQRGVEDVLSLIVSRYMDGITPDLQQWTILATRAQLQQFLCTLDVPDYTLRQYLVRNVDSVTTTSRAEPMELDAQAAGEEGEHEQASGSTSVLGVINLAENSEELPAVVLGSEQWHGQVPTEWVPIITKDTQRQRRQNPQSPLSDAYLSGMPSKRRKIVTNGKPQGSLPQVIAESIRRAVTATGLSQVGNLDTVAQEAGADLTIQSAYRDLLRSRVQSTIQDNEDFTPDRFPNATSYFNKSQQQ